MSRPRLAICLGLLIAACGRTPLDLDEQRLLPEIDAGASQTAPDAGIDTGTGIPDASADAHPDDAQSDAPIDADAAMPHDAAPDVPFDATLDTIPDAPPDVIPECAIDADCNDHIDCTTDTCNSSAGICAHTAVDAFCDDGLFCTGKEICDFTQGCLSAKVLCNDGVACTADTCDETSKSCVSTPDDSNCPISHKCDPASGCYAVAFANDETTLYEVRLPSGAVKAIGPLMAGSVTDIALHPDGTLYAISFSTIYTVNASTGLATAKVSLAGTNVNALDAAPDGTLYAGGGGSLFVADTTNGVLAPVANYPPGITSSGDLAFIGDVLLASGVQGASDVLVELDPVTGASKTLGPIGFDCVWGLAGFGPTLYGLTCNGEILSIDPTSGQGTLLTTSTVQFWGASAR